MKLTESTASHIDNRHFLHNVLPSSIHAPDWFIIYPRDTQKNPSAFCNVSRERKKEDEEAPERASKTFQFVGSVGIPRTRETKPE